MDMDAIVIPAPDFLLERIGTEITVYHPVLTTSFYLNETGALIWELCDGKRSVGEIIGLLSEQYPESRDTISRDVITLVEQLVERKVASLDPAPGGRSAESPG